MLQYLSFYQELFDFTPDSDGYRRRIRNDKSDQEKSKNDRLTFKCGIGVFAKGIFLNQKLIDIYLICADAIIHNKP
jgi:hypothetical protein